MYDQIINLTYRYMHKFYNCTNKFQGMSKVGVYMQVYFEKHKYFKISSLNFITHRVFSHFEKWFAEYVS